MSATPKPVRVGVWGAGAWGEKHARVYETLPTAELIGVYDRHEERAREVAARHGARAFASADELLAACEAVSIAVPTVAHRAALEQACAAGRHALVEKPMAATLEEAEAMIASAKRAGITLQIGQVERFNPAMVAARPFLRSVKFIEGHRMAMFQPRSLDIDVVFDLMIHDLDLVLHVVGSRPTSISAVGVAVLSSNEDIANARLEFADGCVANLTASRVSQERLRRIRFFQDDAYVSVDLFEKAGEALTLDKAKMSGAATPLMGLMAAFRRNALQVPAAEPLTLELDAFVRSLRGDGEGAASATAGRDALAVAQTVRSAMKQRASQWALPPSAVS
jgi:predicted dehydrogenase